MKSWSDVGGNSYGLFLNTIPAYAQLITFVFQVPYEVNINGKTPIYVREDIICSYLWYKLQLLLQGIADRQPVREYKTTENIHTVFFSSTYVS